MVDIIAIGLRALSVIAALQAAGTAMFLNRLGGKLQQSERSIRSQAKTVALVALALTLAQQFIEPGRLVGAFSGIFDRSLQLLWLNSDAGTTTGVRALGLLLIISTVSIGDRARSAIGLIGATLVAMSFVFMGHTTADESRWLLAISLAMHVVIVAFWFGSLAPIFALSRLEDAQLTGSIVDRFSALATWSVPLILIAGLIMATVLLPDFSSLTTPYGLILTAKLAGFSLLLILASINKWRLTPSIDTGSDSAKTALRISVVCEWTVIASLISATILMTSLFSPEH